MGRVFGSHISLEMFLLWVVEFFLCFFSFYLLLLPADAAATAGLLAGQAGLAHTLADPGFAAAIGLHMAPAGRALLLSCAIGMASLAIGLYRPEICLQTRRLLLNTVVAGLLAFPVVLVASAATDIDPSFVFGPDAFWPVKILLTSILLLFLPRLGLRIILRLGLLTRNVVIVGSPLAARRTEAAIAVQRRGFFRVAGVVPAADLAALLAMPPRHRRIWAVIVTPDADLQAVRATLGSRHLRVVGQVEFCERHLRRMDLAQLAPDWLRGARGLSCGQVEAAIRRAAEIAMSLALLGLTLPLLLLTALLIKLDSPGPVLYRQQRVGFRGQVFTLYKLRSMRLDAEAGGPAWATRHDSRVTRVGALIRLTRIDELPQLVNVLRGEMSFVGPRPERPPFVTQLTEQIPHYPDRTLVKPGVTGWAQVNYPYGASVEDARQKLSYDLFYVKHRSLFLDALIVLATIRVILFQEGAR
jgi:exopolysaccharide biosynthesis polyprenyl glycosylphosphotransferase